MKRTFLLLLTITLTLFTACGVWADTAPVPDGAVSPVPQEPLADEQEQETDSAALSALRQEAATANCPCAVAYLNFTFDAADFPAIPDTLAESCPFLADAVCVDAGGEDVYAIVPADPDGAVKVYDNTPRTGSELPKILTATGRGDIVLLRCNESDIMCNVFVRVSNSDGQVFDFHPFLSLENGRLGTEGVYDFTEYPLDMPQ